MKIVILGAGLAGLSAALHLKGQADYALYEREASVGGLCRSFYVEGFTFDFSGHLLHLRDDYFTSLIKNLLGERLKTFERDAWIFSQNTFTRYPFQENTYGLPPQVISECVAGFKLALAKQKETPLPPRNFADWIVYQFGEGIAKHFMLPYNEKMLTVHPRELTTDWLGRFVPRPTLEQVISGSQNNVRSAAGYNANFYYPKKGGIGVLPNALLSELPSVNLGEKAVQINTDSKTVLFESGHAVKYDLLLSTIPLPELLDIITDLPDAVREAGKKLRHNAVFCLNLGINREKISNCSWIYFPESQYCFYRVGFYSNLNPTSAPPNTSSLYAEVSYSKELPVNKEKLSERIIADLIALGILREEDKILAKQELDMPYAYVIFDFNRSAALQTIVQYLESQNIRLAGRYGQWKYLAMEDTLISGKETAALLLK